MVPDVDPVGPLGSKLGWLKTHSGHGKKQCRPVLLVVDLTPKSLINLRPQT